jgi:hypothetical protein
MTPQEVVAQQKYDQGEVPYISTFIDDDTIIMGYGKLDYDFEYPLPTTTIIKIHGTTSWSKKLTKMNIEVIVFEQDNKQVIKKGNHFFTRVFENGETFESTDFNTLERAKGNLGIAPTTEENNKVIAKFMGLVIITDGISFFDTNYNFLKKYQSDWNDLMEVVEKIESKGFDVHINTCVCRISDVGEDRFEDIETFNSYSKIQAVYSGVVEFINWQNEQDN